MPVPAGSGRNAIMKVRIVKNWSEPDLLRQTPGGAGRWNDFEFVIGPGAEPADFVVALNNRFDTDVAVACPSDRLLTLMQEPFVPGFTDWMDMDLEVYSKVLSSHRPRSGVAFERSHPAVAWHVNRSYDQLSGMALPAKTHLMSWICGNARSLPGHRDRLAFLQRLQSSAPGMVDLFGRAARPIDDKWDGLAPYHFSLAIENTVATDYWTEKVADCFLSWTCPIYHGAPNLADFFPRDSFIQIDIARPREALERVREIANAGRAEWERRLPAITEARRLVLERWQLFPHLAARLEALGASNQPVVAVTIPHFRPRLASSLRRRWQRWKGIARRSLRSRS
ncbi:MAG: hypothetical protein EBR71_03225 [Planctomycetes bacterium]|nr:hypothetical protein [Planctomycetota bacterium]